ncbi:MAG: T9SS type A sorting domain-containing protein [Bacteroidetes bacterium]|nr:T9SS type A sorting domain-containing protein [Bacteroidota bacterium]
MIISMDCFGQGVTPLSRGWYRIPYENLEDVKITRDAIDHGKSNSNASANVGPIDMKADNSGKKIVAMGSGTISSVSDSMSECGCASAYKSCANKIKIDHPWGETTEYVHIRQFSASGNGNNQAGLQVGDCVAAGQFIAVEGDVGWTCGSGKNPTLGLCVTSAVDTATKCGRHLHLNVRSEINKLVNPRICTEGVATHGYIFKDNATYTANGCGDPDCDENFEFSGTLENDMKDFSVNNNITTDGNAVIKETASISFQAGNKIVLSPGFRVENKAFFLAIIGPCHQPHFPACNNKTSETDISDEDYTLSDYKDGLKIYPNPFGNRTRIEYQIMHRSRISLSVYNDLGQIVDLMIQNEYKDPGSFETTFEAGEMPKGIYLVSLVIVPEGLQSSRQIYQKMVKLD